ncbi:MAG: glucokinase [Candidatus Binataceae bacterium]|nr:glucokinase [Candidatus Binataceae bacterium]
MILAGDIGGTKTHLALCRRSDSGLDRFADKIYRTRDYPSLVTVCTEFLKGAKSPDALCFGVPGPVIGGRSHATNVAWAMEQPALSAAFAGRPVCLMNDLEATAYGVLHLAENETIVLQAGEHHPDANCAVIAAGTGLGEAALIAQDGRYRALASEGGHADFAPRGVDQINLMKFLAAEFGHASYERALSGPGLTNIYQFLKASTPVSEPSWLSDELNSAHDPAAVISQAALANRDARCVQALEMMVAIYGAEAANLALKVLALGGVYLGGGIAPKILPMLQRGGFVSAFNDKGRLGGMLRTIPIRVVLNQDAGLIGAAYSALAMLGE